MSPPFKTPASPLRIQAGRSVRGSTCRRWPRNGFRVGPTAVPPENNGRAGQQLSRNWGGEGFSLDSPPASDSLPETLAKPLIWANPSFMVPNGASVFIWCQGTHRALEYQLHFEGLRSALERPNAPGLTNKVKFSIRSMTSSTAGRYTCFYQTGGLWSEPSDPLDLVITGKCLLL